MYQVAQSKAHSFYDSFFRRDELPFQTHYCPGCGHGIVHKLIAEAIDDLHIQDRTILISPVGCSVFAYYYFDVGNVQAAHGRAPAVATGVKRGHPETIVISYQGDGDLAAIGTNEIVHAANRGEGFTVFFVNNAIYGMTGGQMAPTTLIGQKSTTTPFGRAVENEGYPLKVCELLATLDAPAYIERVSLHDSKNIMRARKAIRKALETQVNARGFSLVEILSPCPTIWKMDPTEAKHWVGEAMTKAFPLGVYRDKPSAAAGSKRKEIPLEEVPRVLGFREAPAIHEPRPQATPRCANPEIKIAGFGGQGVLFLGMLLAEAGMEAGLNVSWLPSYGPEMRGGTAHCHVRLSDGPISSPLVSQPTVLIAMNEPSLRKFEDEVVAQGLILYNSTTLPSTFTLRDRQILLIPATEIADHLGSTRVANMVLLGALLERTGILTTDEILQALPKMISKPELIELNRRAMEAGKDAARKGAEV